MKMTYEKLNSWIMQLANTKPYRMTLKNGNGFYEIVFLYNEYHYTDKLNFNDLEDELACQKKVLKMCQIFEQNIKLLVF